MKKLIAFLIALTLVFTVTAALTQTAYAAGGTHTITVTNNDAAETHEYTAYQVFSGSYSPESVLTDISWGSGVDGDALLDELRTTLPDFAECVSAAQAAQILSGYAGGSEQLRSFAACVDKHLAAPADSAAGGAEAPAVLTVDGDGYYFVKDTSPVLSFDTYSDYILLVEGDVTVAAKDTAGVVSEKKVKDINDSTGEGSGWQDSADYDVGDPVPFQISGTVAADYDKYDSYKLIFHDRESAGLTFSHITGVFVDGAEIEAGWELVMNPGDDCTFEVVFADLKTVEAVHGGSVVCVEYLSVLNDEAVIGVPGNPDEMQMEYSNNPTDEASTGFTPWDKVVVFTYELTVTKTDENGDKLTGAEFTLEKWVIDDEYPEGHWVLVPGVIADDNEDGGLGRVLSINGKPVKTLEIDGVKWYKLRDKPNEQSQETDIYLKASEVDAVNDLLLSGIEIGIPYYENKDGVITLVQGNFTYSLSNLIRAASDGATFVWSGVDDGHYRITETVTPPGYNTLDPIEFDVSAEHETESEYPQLISVDGLPFVSTAANIGILECEIINAGGWLMPSTGGIGTTIFYVLGGIMVIGAGVVLVVRKKSEE